MPKICIFLVIYSIKLLCEVRWNAITWGRIWIHTFLRHLQTNYYLEIVSRILFFKAAILQISIESKKNNTEKTKFDTKASIDKESLVFVYDAICHKKK